MRPKAAHYPVIIRAAHNESHPPSRLMALVTLAWGMLRAAVRPTDIVCYSSALGPAFTLKLR
jgi:hypothetical protein